MKEELHICGLSIVCPSYAICCQLKELPDHVNSFFLKRYLPHKALNYLVSSISIPSSDSAAVVLAVLCLP